MKFDHVMKLHHFVDILTVLSKCFKVESSHWEESAPPFAMSPPFALKPKPNGNKGLCLQLPVQERREKNGPLAPPSIKMVQFLQSDSTSEHTGKEAQGSRVWEAW